MKKVTENPNYQRPEWLKHFVSLYLKTYFCLDQQENLAWVERGKMSIFEKGFQKSASVKNKNTNAVRSVYRTFKLLPSVFIWLHFDPATEHIALSSVA